MAKKKFKFTTTTAAIIAIAVVLFVVFFATSGQTARFFYPARVAAQEVATPHVTTLVPLTIQVPLPFPVTSGGNAGWDDCTSIDGGVAAVKNFCTCKGNKDIYDGGTRACYKMNSASKWQWTQTQRPLCAEKSGNDTGYGLATTQIKCI